MPKIKISFDRTIHFETEIDVTDKQLEILKENEGNDIYLQQGDMDAQAYCICENNTTMDDASFEDSIITNLRILKIS